MQRVLPLAGDRHGAAHMWLALALALTGGATARAQHGHGPAVAPEPDAAPAADAKRPLVLCSLADLPPEAQSEAQEALLAQFSLLDAELRFDDAAAGAPAAPLGERIASGQRHAHDLGAIAVFWFDTQSGGRWFVHMMDPASERVLVRPVDASSERRSAAIEAAAVMMRESARALIEGGPLPEDTASAPASPVAAQPEPPSPPAGPPAKPANEADDEHRQRPFQLWAAYHGDQFSQDPGLTELQNGISVGAAWFGLMPIYIGARFVFTPPITATLNQVVEFELQRSPFALAAGFRERAGVGAFDLELGLAAEILQHGPPVALQQGAVAAGGAGGTDWIFALAPRVRGELFAAPFVSFFAALGLDVILNSFEYQAEVRGAAGTPQTVLEVAGLRPVAELGLAFYP